MNAFRHMLLLEPPAHAAAASGRARWVRGICGFQPAAARVFRCRWQARPGDLLAITGSPAAWRPAVLDAVCQAALAESGLLSWPAVEQIELQPDLAAIDQVHLPRGRAHRLLCGLGMDCAARQTCAAAELSDEDRWRLQLAVALADAAGGGLVRARRWAHELDGVAARRLCRSVRGIVGDMGVVLAVETARHELLRCLAPRIHLQLCPGGVRVGGPAADRLAATLEPAAERAARPASGARTATPRPRAASVGGR